MIRLRRDRSEDAINHNFYGNRKKAFEKELLLEERNIKRRKTGKHDFKGKGQRSGQAKEQLFVETNNKCAYCETTTKTNQPGDVEHYRPKSSYWWLAYCYDNYLVSCRICNQVKTNHFPTENKKMQGPAIHSNTTEASIESLAGTIVPDPRNENQVNEFMRQYRQEGPLLINPYFDDPAEYFAWRADDVLREIEVTPNTENPDVEIIATASIKHYDLNRQSLKGDRYAEYYKYNTFRRTLEDDGISSDTRRINTSTIERMKAPSSPFAGMIRYFDAIATEYS